MRRREFITGFLVAGAYTAYGAAQGQIGPEKPFTPDPSVKRALVMFKCHLDVGFINTQAAVMRMYFEHYYPLAIQIAATTRQSGEDRYIWTTESWLLYEYLEQAGSEQRKRMEQALADGDIAWHALPFTWQTELLDPTMIAGAVGFSKVLDRRYGRVTTGAKMTDVPGHSRGLVSPLTASGVKFLDIGANPAVVTPETPPVFLWQDVPGSRLIVMYHDNYGGVVRVPGSDLAVAVEVRGDNSGPHTPEEIREIYANLRQRFPNAVITAANLTQIGNAVEAFEDKLPVFRQEIGDTWIYGAASDPVKVCRYREAARLRRQWIAQGKFRTGDSVDIAVLRRLALAAEHTWGADTKTWLDFDHYTPHDLTPMLDRPNYRTMENSWAEKRNDVTQGVAGFPDALRAEAEERIAGLKATRPALAGLNEYPIEKPLETAHFIVQLDPATGAVHRLVGKSNGREWASQRQPLALFTYQTLSKQDFDRFIDSYVPVKFPWALKDLGKPNIERFGAQSRIWTPKLIDFRAGEDGSGHRALAQLSIEDAAAEASGLVAWPREMYLEMLFPNAEPVMHVNFTWLGKVSNRLPEAMWLTFQPDAPEPRGWTLQKVDQPVSPFDVVAGGNRSMHALSSGLSYKDARGELAIDTLDAPVVALGVRSPLNFSMRQPDLAAGIHFCLYNNAFGTNYIQWFGEDVRCRFTLKA